jgi:hypothetical protein
MSPSAARLACLVLLSAAGVCAAAPAPEQTTLRYRFKEGEKLHYVLEQNMTMDMNVAGQDVKMEMKQLLEMTWHVTGVDKDGKARMTQTITRLRFNMDGPTGTFEYDSKAGKEPNDPVGEQVAPFLKALVGADMTLTMDSRGRIGDVKLSDKFKEAIKNMPGAAAGNDFASEEGLKRLTSQGGLTLPAGAAAKGDSWSSKLESKTPAGNMVVDTKFTYEGPETRDGKKLDRVALRPTATLEPDPNAAFALKIKSQDAKGTARFDNAAGRLVETGVTQVMEMEVDAGGQTVLQTVKSTTTMKLADGGN